MKAVWTIFGWWTAAAAAAGGAGMELEFEVDGCSAELVFVLAVVAGAEDVAGAGADDGGAEPLTAAPFGFVPSPPALEPDSCMLAGFVVGEPTSMGSVGDGADIWIFGVGMGTTRVEAGSSAPPATVRSRWEGSVVAAMDTVERMPLVGGRESIRVAMMSSSRGFVGGSLSASPPPCVSVLGKDL